ncbi:MAG: TIM barrel protein [Pseudomonadota bacterium]
MPKFCANLTWLFTELPLIERVEAAADAGFTGVEILSPYDVNAQELRDACVIHNVQMVLINCPPPNYVGGEQGWAAIPHLEMRFRKDFARVLRYASVLKPQFLHVMSGVAEGPEAEACFIENLRWACAEAPLHTITVEVINRGTMPGYFLHDYDQAARIIDAVGAPNLALQFDTFHAHQITGDVCATWAKHSARAAHIQVGNGDDRHEPSVAPFDHPTFFEALDKAGYDGWVSGEYTPAGATRDGLGWIS